MGELDSLVHDRRDRGRIIGKQFPYCKAKDVPVNDGQRIYGVLRGRLLNEFIEVITPFDNTSNDLPSVRARPRLANGRIDVDRLGQLAFERLRCGMF